MLKQQYRFHGYNSLRFVFKTGKTFRSRHVAVRVADNPRRKDSRATVVVAKKVLKSSPLRNRVRRRVYEILRTNWEHIKPAQDILITINEPDFFAMPHEELKESVLSALKQAGVYLGED